MWPGEDRAKIPHSTSGGAWLKRRRSGSLSVSSLGVRLRQEVMAEPLALVDRLDYAPRQLNIILRLLWPYVHRLEQVASSLQLRRCC